MRDGKVSLAYSRFLGYKKGADGRPEIVEEEAAIIRKIYDLFLSGKTINEIAAILTNMGVLTPAGRTKWSISTVRSILSNEKYKGEALLQKTFTVDYLTKEVGKTMVRCRLSGYAILTNQLSSRKCLTGCSRCWRYPPSAGRKYAPDILLPGSSSVATAAPFMVTKSGGCAVQASITMFGTVTTSTTATRPAILPDSGMRKSKRPLRKCCKNVTIPILSIPMRDGTSWWSPSRSAGAAT
nr:recombinase family protein [Faecalicoccus pleomorphus]